MADSVGVLDQFVLESTQHFYLSALETCVVVCVATQTLNKESDFALNMCWMVFEVIFNFSWSKTS